MEHYHAVQISDRCVNTGQPCQSLPWDCVNRLCECRHEDGNKGIMQEPQTRCTSRHDSSQQGKQAREEVKIISICLSQLLKGGLRIPSGTSDFFRSALFCSSFWFNSGLPIEVSPAATEQNPRIGRKKSCPTARLAADPLVHARQAML